MINPSFTNSDRSQELIAIVVDDVLNAGLSQVNK